MKKENLVSYAMGFASFLLDEKIAKDIDRIILFGSVPRGTFDEESDVDFFIDTKKEIEAEVQAILSLFNRSEVRKKWELKGIKNELSVKTGDLAKWKLRRDILTDGIILYGKYKELPENIEYYVLIQPSFAKFKKVHKVKIWRKLYGYRQKVGKKTYQTRGLIERLGGKRVESGIIVPTKSKSELLSFLNSREIGYTINELWSDNL